MKSRAAVTLGPGEPLEIVEVDVAPPQAGEVLMKIFPYRGMSVLMLLPYLVKTPEGVFPASS